MSRFIILAAHLFIVLLADSHQAYIDALRRGSERMRTLIVDAEVDADEREALKRTHLTGELTIADRHIRKTFW